MTQAQIQIESPIGPLFLTASNLGLTGVHWTKQSASLIEMLDISDSRQAILSQARDQLDEYFTGKRREFHLALDPEGTDFQKKVWMQLKEIPYGQTTSYSEIARRIDCQGAARAVGTANGKNPLCIIVPCHRVVPVDGGTGGYSGGPHIKDALLKLEQRHAQ